MAITSSQIEGFKQSLLSKGIDWDENQIRNYLTLKQAGDTVSTSLAETSMDDSQRMDRPMGVMETFSQAQPLQIPQEEKSAMYDFVGNFVWEALDMASWGTLGWADWTDPIESTLTGEEGPETFAGRIGAGLGGFLGFLGPMALTGGTLGAISAAGKYGSAAKAADLTRKGSQFLAGEAGIAKTGYKAFRKLTPNKQKDFFKPFADDVVELGPKVSNKTVREAYIARFTTNLRKELSGRLKTLGIKPTKANLDRLENIIQRSAGVSANSSLPIATLEGRIALAIGGANSAVAAVAATALAEGLTFAAVETPFEIFQSMEEGREMDLPGRWGHAFALGNALGLIKYVPGGLSWKDGGIAKTAWKGMQASLNNKRPYRSYDVNNPDAREQLVLFARGLYNRTGSTLFKDKLKGLTVNSKTDLDILGQTPEGAKKLITVLESVEKDFQRRWAPEFFKNMASDLTGSTPRMLMGSLAFNYEMVFDDRIPLEDKIFHALLGAYMTKKGRVLEYTNANGGLEKINITDTKPVGRDFEVVDSYLRLLKIDPQLYNWQASVNAEQMLRKHMRNVDDNPDIQALKDVLVKNQAIVVDDGLEPSKPKQSGVEGQHPIYEYLRNVYDYAIGHKDGTRMLNVDRMSQKQIKTIEKSLKDHDFTSIVKDGGIESPAHIDDIFYAASDANTKKLIDTHIDAAIGIYNYLVGAENGISRSGEKNTLTTIYRIIPEAGIKLTAENKKVLDKYNRILDALSGRYLNVDRNRGRRTTVTNEKFEGMQQLVERYETQIDKIIYGEEMKTTHTQAMDLMQEGFIYELIKGQDFYKSIRQTYEKLNDLRNEKENWALGEENKPHDGTKLGELINKLLIDDSGFLASTLDFGPNISNSHKQMLRLLHQILSIDPNQNAVLFEQQGTELKITNANRLKELRNLLYKNGLVGFMNENLTERQIFLDEYAKHAFERFTHGAIKRDGKPLNHNDRAALSQLMDFGLLGPNFQLVDVVGVINHIEQVVDMSRLNFKDGKLYNKDGSRFVLDAKQFAQSDAPESLKEFIRETANETGIIPTQQLEIMLKGYKDFIEPFMVDGVGNGFIKHAEVIAQVRPHQILDFVQKLDTIYKMRERQFHDNLLEKLEMLKSGQEFNKADREKLNYLFYLYSTGQHATSKIIKAFNERGLYDFKEDKATIDPTDKTLSNKLQEIIAEVEWDIASASDATKIDNNINTYRSGRDAKITEVEIYRSMSKQTIINDYNLDKDIDFKKDNVKDVIDNAYIVKNGEKFFFKEGRGDHMMDYKEKQKFIMELNKVVGGVSETRTLRRLFGTEGYGIHTQLDYQVYNNHFFDFLDTLVGKDGFAVVDYDFMRTNNRIESARTGAESKNKLYNLLNDSRTHIDKELRKDDFGALVYESRDSGSLVIEVPGLQYAIAIDKSKLPDIFNNIRKSIDTAKGKYRDGKFKPIFKEIERQFNLIAKKVEKEREVTVTKEVNGKKVETVEMEKYTEYEYKEQSALEGGLALETLMQVSYLDKWLKDLYWEELSINVNNGDALRGAKLLRRIKLFANTSMRRQSEGQLDVSMALYKKYLNTKDSQYKSLQKLKKKGGMEIIIARDENFGADGKQFSILKELKEQLKEVRENAKDEDKAGIEYYENLIKTNRDGELEFAGGGDISKVDSYMAVSETMMEALYTLNGASYMTGLGGIKPIIHRVGDAVLIGKTAFIRDPRLDKLFKKNDVDAILFDSGAKIKGKNTKIFEDFISFDDLATKDVKAYKELLKLEDFSLGSIVNSEHDATLSYQVTNHLSPRESKDMFNWLLNDKLNNYINETGQFFRPDDPLQGLSMAKFLAEKNGTIDPNSIYSRWISNNGFVHSQIVMPDFINQVKRTHIDNGGIMKMKTVYGNQSVNAPGENLKFTIFKQEDGKNVLYQYGEADLPSIAGNKPISLDRLHLIQRSKTDKDVIVKATDVKGQEIEIYKVLKEVKMMEDTMQLAADDKPRDVWVVNNIKDAKRQLAQIKKGKGKGKNFKTIKKISEGYYVLEHKRGDNKYIYIEGSKEHQAIEGNLSPDAARTWTGEDFMYKKTLQFSNDLMLRDAVRVARDLSKETGIDYQIAVAFRRNPSTRPGDVAIVGVKDILSENYGNQVKLNALDFALRLEGDFDVDKTDFWWDTPTSILNKWSDLSGSVLRVNPDPLKNKSSLVNQSASGLDKPLNILDAKSVREWDLNLANSEKMRGTVIKTQRLIQALEHYDSHSNILKGDNWEGIKGLSINLEGTKGGGILYIDPVKLKRAKEVLAEDIQNITDSLTGYDLKRYNDKWFDKFLFGDESGNYDGIFAKGAYDKTKKVWTPNAAQKWIPNALEKRVIMEVIQPYRAMLQLGTQLYSNGKAEAVRYEDILSQMREFDAFFSNLTKNVYWKLRKEGDKRGFSLDELEGYFKKDGDFINVYGDFANQIRPNLFGERGKVPMTQFENMLPFERTMSILALNDNTSLNLPGYLGGEMLQRYHDFYGKYMYAENFNDVSSNLIRDINKNDRTFGYINYLDWRIKAQQRARRNAIGNHHTSLVDVITESINKLQEQKTGLEEVLIYDTNTQGMEYAKKLRDGAIQNLINSVYMSKRLPAKWNKFAAKRGESLDKNEQFRKFRNAQEVSEFVNSNLSLFSTYIKRAGVVRLKGMHSPEQLELMIWHNMLEKYERIGIRDEVSGEERIDLDLDVKDFSDFYKNIWKKHFTGGDWTMDTKRVNNLVLDMLETKFMKWEKQAGAGQLFLWKLMSPKTDPYMFTYFNKRITPAFTNESLSLLKLGLRFLNGADNKFVTDFQKNNLFSYMTNWYNSSFRAAYGQPGEAGFTLTRMLSNQANMRSDIFKGAPLMDDIRGWRPGYQESVLNPQLKHLFGNDPRSISHVFASSALDPSVIKDAVNVSTWAYNPITYIPENVTLMNYPSINGYKNFKEVISNSGNIMLGSGINQRLLFRKAPILEKQAHENIQPNKPVGSQSLIDQVNNKVKIFC